MMSRDINQQSSEISCDRCKIELNDTHELEVEISSESPINHYFDKIKTSIIQFESIPVQCTVCMSGVRPDIINYCMECEQHLCIRCRDDHGRISTTHDHHIVLAKDRLPLNVKNTCRNHRNKLTIFCRNCNSPVCYLCCIEYHISHEHMDIRKEAEERRRLLLVEAKEMKQSVSSIQQQLSELEKAVDEWNSNREKLDDLISKDAKEKMARLEQDECNLKTQLQDLHQKGLDQLSNLQGALQRQQKYLECFKHLQEVVADKGSDCEVIHFSSSLPSGQLKLSSGLPEARRPERIEFSPTDLGSFMPNDLDFLGRIVQETGNGNSKRALTWEQLREQLIECEQIIHENNERIQQDADKIRLLTQDREKADKLRKKLEETECKLTNAVEQLNDFKKEFADVKQNRNAATAELSDVKHQLTFSEKKCQQFEQDIYKFRQELQQQRQVNQHLLDICNYHTTLLNDANQQKTALQQTNQELESKLRIENKTKAELTSELQHVKLAVEDANKNRRCAEAELVATQQRSTLMESLHRKQQTELEQEVQLLRDNYSTCNSELSRNEQRVVQLQQQVDQLYSERLPPGAGNK
jgi:septal ring factor EnvC (AmiA/AmiB activator)